MGILELLVLAVGLSMDAFAVSICKGLVMNKVSLYKAAICGIWFGGFQALMPLIGYLLGINFSKYIVEIDHWIAFGLLAVIGINLLKEAFGKDDDEVCCESLGIKIMFIMAIATSIDALAVGITFVCVPLSLIDGITQLQNTLIGVSVIGIITFFLSCAGVKVGNMFGMKYKSKAEITGGIVLILLGIKILIEHLIMKI